MDKIIKFRAWDKKAKRMIDCESWDSTYVDMGLNQILRDKHYIFLQYIGIKDRNLKEIYNGDIVECIDLEKAMIFTSSIVWIEDVNCWGLCGDGDAFPFVTFSVFKGRRINIMIFPIQKVIGNIYENPELTAQQSSESTTGEKK